MSETTYSNPQIRKDFRISLRLGIFSGITLLLLALLNSCSILPEDFTVEPLTIPGATYIGNQACYYCHTNYVRSFPSSAHGRMHLPGEALAGGSGCESCHGPGSKHIEVGGGRNRFIMNPGKTSEACFRCHLDIQGEFNLPQHHPVPEGRMNCVQCHDPHGGDIFKRAGGPAMSQQNESCAGCHREQTRPFVFEHEAMREGCTVCHAPHGSINRKLLVAADVNLCLRCHAQVQSPGGAAGSIYIGKIDHTDLLQQGACWSAGCHTAIHGSNVDPRMRF